MSGIDKIQLDEFVDPFEVNLNIRKDDAGEISEVSFDLSGLPRVDTMLVGRPAIELPDITKKLCGICPVVHHLAGVAAVEALYGINDIPPAATAIRELLASGSALDTLAAKYITSHREFAVGLKRAGKAIMAVAGAPTHFPDVAIPGGVRSGVNVADATEAVAQLQQLESQARQLCDAEKATLHAGERTWRDTFPGAEVAVVKQNGAPAQLGNWLAIATAESTEMVPAHRWHDVFREQRPGHTAPRPVVTIAGHDHYYRVGPLARSVIAGNKSVSPSVAQLESVLHYIRTARALLCSDLVAQSPTVSDSAVELVQSASWEGTRTGVGLIDGPRGLLVHSYTATSDGRVVDCQIMTPTAQNEPWLAHMLSERFQGKTTLEGSWEAPIRMADPCLPCSDAPEGLMNVRVREE